MASKSFWLSSLLNGSSLSRGLTSLSEVSPVAIEDLGTCSLGVDVAVGA